MNVQWFRIRSWHIASGLVSRAGHPKALCGRWGKTPDTQDDRGEGPTCESCYRIGGPK